MVRPLAERPPTNDPADVATTIIRYTLSDYTRGAITVTEAQHTIRLALPLATPQHPNTRTTV